MKISNTFAGQTSQSLNITDKLKHFHSKNIDSSNMYNWPNCSQKSYTTNLVFFKP